MRWLLVAVVMTAAALSTACGGQEAPPPDGAAQPSTAFLARHKPMNGGPRPRSPGATESRVAADPPAG